MPTHMTNRRPQIRQLGHQQEAKIDEEKPIG